MFLSHLLLKLKLRQYPVVSARFIDASMYRDTCHAILVTRYLSRDTCHAIRIAIQLARIAIFFVLPEVG